MTSFHQERWTAVILEWESRGAMTTWIAPAGRAVTAQRAPSSQSLERTTALGNGLANLVERQHEHLARVFNVHDWTHIRYTSDDDQRVLREHGIEGSRSGRGNCWDHAVVESFFGPWQERSMKR